MHETVMPDLVRLIGETGARVVDTRAEIQHLGYEGDQSHKHVRNLPLLRAALDREPGRIYYWHHLVSTLEAMGDSEEALVTAAEVARRIEDTELSASERPIASLLLCTYARLLHGRGDDAMPTIDAGLGYYPEHAFLRLIKAQVLIDRNEPQPALDILADLAAVDSATYADESLSHDRRVFDVWAHDLTGVALLRLGRRAEAAAAFARAAEAAPDEPSYRVKAMAIRPASPPPGTAVI
jgi:tetratricopeptide (TPR) repeat protein